MLEDLKTYFTLASNFRTSNSISQRIIVDQAMPQLAASTPSPRLKGAIFNFIQENARAHRTA